MQRAPAETSLKIRGYYVPDPARGAVYRVELRDGEFVVDTLDYRSAAARVCTPNGYPKTPNGARRHARDYWF